VVGRGPDDESSKKNTVIGTEVELKVNIEIENPVSMGKK